jgi:hypothetical protein
MSTPSPVRSLTDSRTAELDRQHGSWWYMLSARRPIDGLWIGQSKQGKDQIGSYLRFLVPLARLKRATCCLGDNGQSSALYGSIGSGQVRLGGVSGESGLFGFSCGLWNDRENDQLSKQRSICRLGCRVARRSGGRRLGGHPGSRRQGRQPLGGEPRPLDVAASREPVPGGCCQVDRSGQILAVQAPRRQAYRSKPRRAARWRLAGAGEQCSASQDRSAWVWP